MVTCHIHFKGRVQGVGFRPHVYRLARKMKLTGWVNNTSNGVHIHVTGEVGTVGSFYQRLLKSPPRLAIIQSHSIHQIRRENYDSFEIVKSARQEATDLLITPDFAICDDCRRELFDPDNRRYHYPFITCTNCGPRYSIIQDLPYDRPNTTMDFLEMCDECADEYQDPENRRYYSQTNSCGDCAIDLSLRDSRGELLSVDPEEIILSVADALQSGKIIAVKGIGGYLIMTDARNEASIKLLRSRKRRPQKPFAVMFPSLDLMEKAVSLTHPMIEALNSPASPVVLAPLKAEADICAEDIAPGNPFLGVMLPYAPLFELILSAFNGPVVATSGNISGSPIIYEEVTAHKILSSLADLILDNNRDIVVPQDDSVLRFTATSQQPIFLRRSRGYAPSLIHKAFGHWNKPVLAVGGELKNTFGLIHQGQTYVSQYLGDMKEYLTQQSFNHTLEHLIRLLDFEPDVILCDQHPAYFTAQLASAYAKKKELPLVKIQHHEAHFAAVLAENNLLRTNESVLGIIWDGTGWSGYETIWGGECFLFQDRKFIRCGHLQPFQHILGDKMSEEPRISALSLICAHPDKTHLLRNKFNELEWKFYNQTLARKKGMATTSMGRFFDGVASLLGLKDHNTFEAEAVMALEFAGMKGRQLAENDLTDRWDIPVQNTLPTSRIINHLIEELENGTSPEILAFRFHLTLAHLVKKMAIQQGIHKIAFSGGVFQNALLTELLDEVMPEMNLYFHQQLPPNDECISYGQLAHFYITQIGNNPPTDKSNEMTAETEGFLSGRDFEISHN